MIIPQILQAIKNITTVVEILDPNQGDWYPGDEWKGDVARIVMYMYLRYPNQCEPISVGEGTQIYSPNGDIPIYF